MFVMTVDQRHSRRGPDLVEGLLAAFAGEERLLRPFERTAGDEVQAVLTDADAVVELTLDLVRDGRWRVGIGVGAVVEPLPASTRAGAGPAFIHARDAVTRAKQSPDRVAVTGPEQESAGRAEAVLGLLAAVVQRRSALGWQAVDLVRTGLTQSETAERLRITPQAVNDRLRAALFAQEQGVRPAAAHLLREADR